MSTWWVRSNDVWIGLDWLGYWYGEWYWIDWIENQYRLIESTKKSVELVVETTESIFLFLIYFSKRSNQQTDSLTDSIISVILETLIKRGFLKKKLHDHFKWINTVNYSNQYMIL